MSGYWAALDDYPTPSAGLRLVPRKLRKDQSQLFSSWLVSSKSLAHLQARDAAELRPELLLQLVQASLGGGPLRRLSPLLLLQAGTVDVLLVRVRAARQCRQQPMGQSWQRLAGRSAASFGAQ